MERRTFLETMAAFFGLSQVAKPDEQPVYHFSGDQPTAWTKAERDRYRNQTLEFVLWRTDVLPRCDKPSTWKCLRRTRGQETLYFQADSLAACDQWLADCGPGMMAADQLAIAPFFLPDVEYRQTIVRVGHYIYETTPPSAKTP